MSVSACVQATVRVCARDTHTSIYLAKRASLDKALRWAKIWNKSSLSLSLSLYLSLSLCVRARACERVCVCVCVCVCLCVCITVNCGKLAVKETSNNTTVLHILVR